MDIYYRKISSILTFNCCSIFKHFLFDETVKKFGGLTFSKIYENQNLRETNRQTSQVYM